MTLPRSSRWPALLAAWLLSSPWLAAQDDVAPTAHPFLWRIEPLADGGPPNYLYGTMHVGDPRITTLPEVVEDALYSSDAVFTELAFEDMMGSFATQMYLPEGRSLRDELPAALYDRVDRLLQRKGLSLAPFERMRLWAFHLVLQTLDFQDAMLAGQPLDMFLYTEAKTMGMEVGGLETIEEQVSVFRDFPPEDQVALLADTVAGLEEQSEAGVDAAEQMVEAYLSGRPEALTMLVEDEASSPLQKRLMERLLPERNVRMAERIDRMIRDAPEKQHLFAVGAAHMPDARGVVQLLRDRGHVVERLCAPPPEAADASLQEVLRELRELRADVRRLQERVERVEARRFF